MNALKIYSPTDIEYTKLRIFASKVNDIVYLDYWVSIDTTYVDYGSDWKYTALITERHDDNSSWQSLNFRDYEKVVTCDSFEQITEWACKYAEGLLDGKICIDL